MKIIKPIFALAIIVVLLFLFKARYLSSGGGVPSTSGDMAAHLIIEEHIKTGDIFPSFSQEEKSLHAVSNFLPIYHGLLGFHVITTSLESMGMRAPGAYLFVMDFSFLIIFLVGLYCIFKEAQSRWRWELLVAVFLLFPIYFTYFVAAVDAAFYSQILSQAMLAMSVFLYLKGYRKVALCFLFYAAFCYPDFLIWFIPVAWILNWPRRILLKAGLAIFWILLMWIPFKRGTLTGPDVTDFLPVIVLYLFVLFFYPSIKKYRELAVICFSFVAYSLVLTLFTLQFWTPSYYAAKIASFSYLLFPMLLVAVPVLNTFRGKVLVTGYLFFAASKGILWSPLGTSYFNPKPIFSNLDAMKTEVLSKEVVLLRSQERCITSHTFAIPSFKDFDKPLLYWAYNSKLKNFDIYEDPKDRPLYKMYRKIEETSLDAPRAINELLKSGDLKPDLCLAVAKENSPLFTESPNFEMISQGRDFVYFKPKRSEAR